MEQIAGDSLGNSTSNQEDSQEQDIETQIYSELAKKTPKHASEKNNYLDFPFACEDITDSTITNEPNSLPEKLDPLSKEFPFSIPNKNSGMYLEARDDILTEEANTSGILTRINSDTKQTERKQLRSQTAEQACKCLVF